MTRSSYGGLARLSGSAPVARPSAPAPTDRRPTASSATTAPSPTNGSTPAPTPPTPPAPQPSPPGCTPTVTTAATPPSADHQQPCAQPLRAEHLGRVSQSVGGCGRRPDVVRQGRGGVRYRRCIGDDENAAGRRLGVGPRRQRVERHTLGQHDAGPRQPGRAGPTPRRRWPRPDGLAGRGGAQAAAAVPGGAGEDRRGGHAERGGDDEPGRGAGGEPEQQQRAHAGRQRGPGPGEQSPLRRHPGRAGRHRATPGTPAVTAPPPARRPSPRHPGRAGRHRATPGAPAVTAPPPLSRTTATTATTAVPYARSGASRGVASGSPSRIAHGVRGHRPYAVALTAAPSSTRPTARGLPQPGHGQRRHERLQPDAAGDQGQRGAHPGQEGALVGQREARVRLAAPGPSPSRPPHPRRLTTRCRPDRGPPRPAPDPPGRRGGQSAGCPLGPRCCSGCGTPSAAGCRRRCTLPLPPARPDPTPTGGGGSCCGC